MLLLVLFDWNKKLKNFIKHAKDFIALFVGVVLQIPTKRFDEISKEYDTVEDVYADHVATVVETVTPDDGKVKYNGTTWNARLGTDCGLAYIDSGIEVRVSTIKGNVVVVLPK